MVGENLSPPNRKEWAFVIILSLLMAVALRWPLSIYWDAAPLEPNFPLHALGAAGVGRGEWLSLSSLEWPDGATVRYIAWPLMVIGGLISWVATPIVSMNLAVTGWIALSMIGIWRIGRAWGWHNNGAVLAALAGTVAPVNMLALGNGQFENMCLFPLTWVCFSAQQGHVGRLAFSLLLCCFSSPYQGVVGAIGGLIFGLQNWRKAVPTMAIVLLLTAWHYGPVKDGMVHESVAPPPNAAAERALPIGWLVPENIAENGGQPLRGPIQRVKEISNTPSSTIYSHRWPWLMSTATSYVGIILLIGGATALIRRRKETVAKKAALVGIVCGVIAMGDTVSIGSTALPLPWTLVDELPGLTQMKATARFLTGLSMAALIGLGILKIHRNFAIVFGVALVADGLLLTPSHWPMPSKKPLPSRQLKNIEGKAPIAFWPAAPIIASHKVTMTALFLERPLALYAERNIGMPEADGRIQRNNRKRMDRNDRSPEEWADLLKSKGVLHIVQFRDIVGSESQPFMPGFKNCDDYFCSWKWSQEETTQ